MNQNRLMNGFAGCNNSLLTNGFSICQELEPPIPAPQPQRKSYKYGGGGGGVYRPRSQFSTSKVAIVSRMIIRSEVQVESSVVFIVKKWVEKIQKHNFTIPTVLDISVRNRVRCRDTVYCKAHHLTKYLAQSLSQVKKSIDITSDTISTLSGNIGIEDHIIRKFTKSIKVVGYDTSIHKQSVEVDDMDEIINIVNMVDEEDG